MTRFEKWSVWGTTLLVAVTGLGYGWAKYLTRSNDPFSVINHPLEPAFLKLHILVAPLFLFAIGMVAVRHIWRHFRSGTRVSRRSGITAALSLAPMVASGYLIQVLTGEGLLTAMIVAHLGFGLIFLAGIGLHQWFLRGRSSRETRVGRARREDRSRREAPGTGRGTAPRHGTADGVQPVPRGASPAARRPSKGRRPGEGEPASGGRHVGG